MHGTRPTGNKPPRGKHMTVLDTPPRMSDSFNTLLSQWVFRLVSTPSVGVSMTWCGGLGEGATKSSYRAHVRLVVKHIQKCLAIPTFQDPGAIGACWWWRHIFEGVGWASDCCAHSRVRPYKSLRATGCSSTWSMSPYAP